MEKRLFEKAFELPLQLDVWGKFVFDNSFNMTLQFPGSDPDNVKIQRKIIDLINGYAIVGNDLGFNNLSYINGDILNDGKLIMLMRGWGYLTGTGGMNLQESEAAAIQDDLAEFIIEKLKTI